MKNLFKVNVLVICGLITCGNIEDTLLSIEDNVILRDTPQVIEYEDNLTLDEGFIEYAE